MRSPFGGAAAGVALVLLLPGLALAQESRCAAPQPMPPPRNGPPPVAKGVPLHCQVVEFDRHHGLGAQKQCDPYDPQTTAYDDKYTAWRKAQTIYADQLHDWIAKTQAYEACMRGGGWD